MKPEAVHEAINLAKTNNQKAFGYLFESFWDYLYNYLLKKIGNEDQAEDIAVRTFAKAFDKIHTFNPSFKFETWLTTISKNIQIDQHRKQNSKNKIDSTAYDERTVTEVQDGNPTPEDLLIITQNLSDLLQKIKTLKREYKTIIRLRYFEELSYKEISIRLDLPINTVKVTLLRAKKVLAQEITKNEE
ncbi:MAG: RNA polymerase sigma factor [Flavobacteriaceae bacterium]